MALPVVGAALDELVGSGLGCAFAIAAVLGAVVGAAVCPPTGRVWVIAAPPLVVAVVTVIAGLVAGTPSPQKGKGLYTSAVRWAVDGFPAMAAAEVTVLVLLAVRVIRSERGGRNRGA
jgi:uncharacterized membrane protein YeaQ/YmgE (transglycosylase-associated protein family)